MRITTILSALSVKQTADRLEFIGEFLLCENDLPHFPVMNGRHCRGNLLTVQYLFLVGNEP